MKQDTPLVSVVIPCFNVAPYLAAALDCVLAQTFQDFEVILVDDGSTDNTLAIMQAYAARDNRIQVTALHKNQGILAARNTSMKEARGQYVAMLDGDDLWTPDALAARYAIAARFPDADVVATDFAWFTDTLPVKPIGQVGQGPRARLAFASCFTTDEPLLIREPFELMATTHFAWTGATLVRRAAMSAIGNFVPDFTGPEDTLLWLRLAQRGVFVFSPKITAFYRQRQGSLVATLNLKGPKELQYLKILDWVKSKPEFARHNAVIRRLTAECHHVCNEYYRRVDNGTAAIVQAVRAVQNQPLSRQYWRSLAATGLQNARHLISQRSTKPRSE